MKDDFDFYEYVISELSKIKNEKKIIPFPLVFQRLGVIFHLTKRNSFKLLKTLQKKGLLKIVPFKGVIISKKGMKT